MKRLFNLRKEKIKGAPAASVSQVAKNYTNPIFNPFPALTASNYTNLSLAKSYQFYEQASPVFNAIDIISQEVATIKPLLYDKKNKIYINNHPLLDLLKNPNTNVNFTEFMTAFASNFLISGNAFTYTTYLPGKYNLPPLELFVENTCNLSILPDGYDGYPEKYIITDYTEQTYLRDSTEFRFFNERSKQTSTSEIYQSKTFSPNNAGSGQLWGLSKLSPLYLDIEQFLCTQVHNLSTLERGARPSGMIVSDEPLSDDQYQRLQEQMNLFYSGSSNAGRVMVVDGGNIQFVPLSQTNKDMDFLELKKGVTETIYNVFRIPLPLISADTMTLSNFETSKLSLYDSAVLPLTSFLYQELTEFLMPKYKGSDNLCLAYDPRDISALAPRHTEQIANVKNLDVLTINEIRELIQYPNLSDGANDLLRPSNLLPVATELPANNAKFYNTKSKEEYVYLMKKQRDENGCRLFTDQEIDNIWTSTDAGD